MNLAEFLLARVAEDEAIAEAPKKWSGRHWEASRQDPACITDDDGIPIAWVSPDAIDPGEYSRHIARHDPARVLAECAAKRAIVELLESLRAMQSDRYYDAIEDVVRLLAAVWADHPDYRAEWAVSP